MTEQWLSIVEYARTFKVSDMTVRRRIKTGKLHAILQDGKYFIPIAGNEARASGGDGRGRSIEAEDGGIESAPYYQPQKPAHDIAVIKGHLSAQKTLAPLASPAPRLHLQHAPAHLVQHSTANSHGLSHNTVPPANQSVNPPRATNFHPHAHGGAHAASSAASSQQSRHHIEANEGSGDYGIPATLRRPLLAQEASLVDTRSLLAFCEASLRKMAESERRTVERFKGKLEVLEATLAGRDLEIKTLRQQLEDLQLLVKILEKRRS